MPVFPFGDYRPDLSDLNTADTSYMANVLPRGDGYGPVYDFDALSGALPAQCRGYFFARKSDGTVAIFAATATKLYLLNSTTFEWSDVSVGGGAYSSPDTDRNWQFAQFNNFVFATQHNAAVQVYDLTASSAFAALAGSPPRAGNIAVVNRFLVLCDLLDYPYRVHWSGLNATTTWTSGTNYSDYQDLPSGGVPRVIRGGELGVIIQDTEIRRMIYAAGSDVIFQIEKIAESVGIIGSGSAAAAGNMVYMYSTRGFLQLSPEGGMAPIGLERVDRTFNEAFDDTALQYLQAAADPRAGVVFWAYRQAGTNDDGFNRLIAYNYNLQKWSPPISISGDYLSSMVQPGLTMEGLDAIAAGEMAITGAANNGSGLIRLTVASTSTLTTGDVKTVSAVGGTTEANGTWTITVVSGTTLDLQGSTFTNAYTSGGIIGGSLDALEFSLDELSSSSLSRLSLVNTEHKAGFFAGDELEATLSTAEKQLDRGLRVDVNGLRPVTDAATVYGRIGMRDRPSGTVTYSTEAVTNDDGLIPQLVNTRLARAVIRIPAGETWTYATGIEPDFMPAGLY